MPRNRQGPPHFDCPIWLLTSCALLKGRQPLTPARLLRLSKDLPHDWNEQGQFLGFAGTIHKFRPERSITPDSKTASRDPTAVRAPRPGVWRLWFSELRGQAFTTTERTTGTIADSKSRRWNYVCGDYGY
jgi:hypothetical protein